MLNKPRSIKKYKNICVLAGGWSSERDISLASAPRIMQALSNQGYISQLIDVQHNLIETLKHLAPDAVFNNLHGRPGEDGTVQAILEFLSIPYTHSGVLSSALAMNKNMAKQMLAKAQVPVPKGLILPRHHAAKKHWLPPPYIIKPNAEGSSLGLFLVLHEDAPPPQELLSPDWAFGDNILIEEYINGRELTCATMGDHVLGVTEIYMDTPFYTYTSKYKKGASTHVCPAKISQNIYQKVQQLTLKAHKALDCRGVSRSDFRYDDNSLEEDGTLVCLEVNTQPGMTETSLVPELAAIEGISFDELVDWIIKDASLDR